MTRDRFVWPVTADRFPGALVALACDGSLSVADGPITYRTESLSRWCASGAMLARGAPKSTWVSQGTDISSFWRAAQYAARRIGQTWIVCHGAARVCALLGLWQRIEAGEVYLGGRKTATRRDSAGDRGPPRVPQSDEAVGAERSVDATYLPGRKVNAPRYDELPPPTCRHVGGGEPGCVIMEDPPTLISCRLAGAPGSLLWLDIRNWGIRCYPIDLPANERAQWMLDVMVRMMRTICENQWGSLKCTAGSQSLHTLRRRYLTHPIHCHRQPDALALERSALYGGRCECRWIGARKEPIYHVDVRSMYPHLCATLPLPTMLSSVEDRAQADMGSATLGARGSIQDVLVQTEEPAYPLRRGREVIWPVGRYRTVLSGPELEDARERGRIVRVYQSAQYRLYPALAAMSRAVWEETVRARGRADVPITQWMKSVGVCLPGKFAQHGGTWEPGAAEWVTAPWHEWYRITEKGGLERCRSIGWECWVERGDEWSDDACPAISAWVTSAGRMMLLRLIRAAGWDEVLYHDTDSLILTAQGLWTLILRGYMHRAGWGDLRLIGSHQCAEIRGIRDYSLDGQRWCAGRPKGDRAAGPLPDTYWYRCQMTRDVTRGRAPSAQEVLQTYARSKRYTHGRVMEDGSVAPIRIDE